MNLFGVNIVGLSYAIHDFTYDLDAAFFKQYGNDLISEGMLKAQVALNKHETFIEATFTIKGTVQLACDRSLDLFDFPIDLHPVLMYKFGDEEKEISEDVVMISHHTATLDVGQPMYEYILLAVPMKKLHPRYSEEDTAEEGTMIYSSAAESADDDSGAVDPRWDVLKKLK